MHSYGQLWKIWDSHSNNAEDHTISHVQAYALIRYNHAHRSLNTTDIEKTLHAFLTQQEGMGDLATGSGHLGHISLTIDTIKISQPSKPSSYAYQVEVEFTRMTETEFTLYPDNPPIEETFNQIVYLDAAGVVSGFSKKILKSSNIDIGQFIDSDPQSDK